MTKREPWISFIVSESFLITIGYVVTQWAYFEDRFDGLLRFMRMKPSAAALSADIPYPFKKRLTLFKDTSTECFGGCKPLLDRLSRIRDEAGRLNKIRNTLAHSHWHGDPDSGHLVALFWEKGKYTSKDVDISTLQDAIVDISAITREIMNINCAGLPVNDYSFPLSQDELSVLRDFQRRNLPPLPTP